MKRITGYSAMLHDTDGAPSARGQRRGCGLSGVLSGDHREPLPGWGVSVLCVGDTGPSLN